jgi:hypothetical protein
MAFSREIKDFTKNTLILTLLFTLVLHLSWSYLREYISLPSFAENVSEFQMANATFLGGYATAVGLNVWLREKAKSSWPVNLYGQTITIAEALSDTEAGQRSLITDNMISINTYLNLLKTDIGSMLDQSIDRTQALDEHISLLKTYFVRTTERMALLESQIADLRNIITESNSAINASKNNIQISYRGLDYNVLETNIESYMNSRQDEVKSRTYLTFLEKFQASYATLQAENAKILDTIINNREAIIKRATIVIPDSGTELMKKLNLLQTEADYKASQQ